MRRVEGDGSGLEVCVRRQLGARLRREPLRRIAANILQHERLPFDSRVSLAVVGERTIQRLNRRFRGKDEPTDVLSFPLSTEGFPTPPGEPPDLGDIVLCYPIAIRQAEEFGHSVEREVGYLFAHGMLHLLGYDHEGAEEQQVMRSREESALSAVGLTR